MPNNNFLSELAKAFSDGSEEKPGSAGNPYYKEANKVTYTKRGATVLDKYVDVLYCGVTHKSCQIRWEPVDFDQRKSTVRIVHRGKHYILWFYDHNIVTPE